MSRKAELRAQARALRSGLAAHTPGFAEVVARFAAALPLSSGAVVASYWPLRNEADPRRLAAELEARGHPILLPGVVGPDSPLAFRRWRAGEPLHPGPAGVLEPAKDAQTALPDSVFVPLLAFDRDGFRLGYGGGFYDRTLARLRTIRAVRAIGIAFAGQEMPHVPREIHDQPLDMIVTETGLRDFQRSET